jgi:hypothetical protein
MTNRIRSHTIKTATKNPEVIFGRIYFGASGAVDSTPAAFSAPGFAVTKTAGETGRYTIAVQDTSLKLRSVVVTPIWPDDTAVTSGGALWGTRDIDTATEGAKDQTFEIQAVDATGADANPASGTGIFLTLFLEN